MDEDAAKKAMEIFTLQEMAEINEMKKKRSEPGLKEDYRRVSQIWEVFIAKVRKNQQEDPSSEVGRVLALEWIEIFNDYYGPFPQMRKILREKADIIEASLDIMCGPGAWPWIKKAFAQHNIALQE